MNHSKFVFFLSIFLLSQCCHESHAELFADIFGGACGVAVGMIKSGGCGQEFLQYTNEFKDDQGRVPTQVYCCAVTKLRYCVLDKIAETCGFDAEAAVSGIVDGLVGKVEAVDPGQPCNGDEFFYRKESPLCWSIQGQCIGAAALILVVALCCCCRLCCRRSSKY